MNLKLYFREKSNTYALDQVEFTSKYDSVPLISQRGDCYGGNGSFKWSQGVKSLSLMFIEAYRNVLSGDQTKSALLEGLQGSFAASLDYALSKQPNWMNEMFGSDHLGKPILFKLIRRENTELKRPGPVSLYLSPLAMRELKLGIYIDSLLVKDVKELDDLICKLYKFNSRTKLSKSNENQEAAPWLALETHLKETNTEIDHSGETANTFISNLVSKNLEEAFNTIEIFQANKYKNHLNSIFRVDTLKKDGANPDHLITQINKNNNYDNLLGLVTESDYQYLRENLKNITVKTNLWGISSHVLLTYLKHIKKIPLNIDFSELHSHAIFTSVANQGDKSKMPEIVILGLGGVLNVAKFKLDYELLLPTPSCTIDLVEPRIKARSKAKNKALLVDIEERTTSGLFALEEIKNENPLIKRRHIKPTPKTYDEVFSMFKEGEDIQTLAHFPHNEIAIKFTEAKSLHQGKLNGFFMISKTISENRKLTHILNAAFRDAWLTIKSQPKLRQLLAQSITNDEFYMKSFGRISGLYQLEG